jgi:hypothetical protein
LVGIDRRTAAAVTDGAEKNGYLRSSWLIRGLPYGAREGMEWLDALGDPFIGHPCRFAECPWISTTAAALLQHRGGGGRLAGLAEEGDAIEDKHGELEHSGTRQVARTAPTTAGGGGG